MSCNHVYHATHQKYSICFNCGHLLCDHKFMKISNQSNDEICFYCSEEREGICEHKFVNGENLKQICFRCGIEQDIVSLEFFIADTSVQFLLKTSLSEIRNETFLNTINKLINENRGRLTLNISQNYEINSIIFPKKMYKQTARGNFGSFNDLNKTPQNLDQSISNQKIQIKIIKK
jgi:hypothetical protein